MTPEQQAILTFLRQNAQGKNNAITADEIFTQLTQQGISLFAGRTQEQVRGFIRSLVNNQGSLIGSSNNGYYVIVTKDDVIYAINNLETRATSASNRADELRQTWNTQNPNDLI